MGKRKSIAKATPKKKMPKLETVFTCPFCCQEGVVECPIDMKNLLDHELDFEVRSRRLAEKQRPTLGQP
ncbi:Transcription elongation factor 1 -like protein [Capsicum chinense]|nr:Transcription elongation factor 1 -like protein [Capsicum chinense]